MSFVTRAAIQSFMEELDDDTLPFDVDEDELDDEETEVLDELLLDDDVDELLLELDD